MSMSNGGPYLYSESYNIPILDKTIDTFRTHSPEDVDNWIAHMLRIHLSELNTLIVGLDIEWLPYFYTRTHNRVAILQLCVGTHCLIFQLLYAQNIPQSLIDFLNSSLFTFVGVGIKEDVKKLLNDYNLHVCNNVDIARLAEHVMGVNEFKHAGLKDLAREVLGIEIEKQKNIRVSRWDAAFLTYDQIMYACTDAFLSHEIGKHLVDTLGAFSFMMFKMEERTAEMKLG